CRSSLHVPCRGENTRSKCPFKFDHNNRQDDFQFLRSAVAATWSDVPRSAVCLNLREEKSSGSSKE
ncbi:hypothetical protein LNW26_27045, partial [Klebsiella pneumoniae]|nr:hypothetical protein [Klebsiella pneumoniae]